MFRPPSSIQVVPIDEIETREDLGSPAEALIESISRHGVLEPLLVQKRERRYLLISGRRRMAAAIALGLNEVPCVVRRLSDDEVRSIASAVPAVEASTPVLARPLLYEDQVAASLASVLSCSDLLADGVPALTRNVAVDMIRAETQRAICAVRTAELLAGGGHEARASVSLRCLLDRIVEAVGPEVRLRGSRLATRIEVSDEAMVNVDPQYLVTALAAVVLLLLAGLRDVRGARLDLSVTSHASGRIAFAIAQDSVILPNATLAAANGEAPVLDSCVASLVALRRLAKFYGGTFVASRLARGTEVTITLPRSE